MSDALFGLRHEPWHKRRGLVALVVATALATCTDDHPTGPGHGGRGYLAIRPVLVAPVNLTSFGFTIDSLRVVAIRPPSQTVRDTTVFFNPDSSTLRLSLSVELTTSPETFYLLLQLRSGTHVLYSGIDTTRVFVGASDTSSNASVKLAYVGPGAGLTHIAIAPKDSVLTLGGTKQFRVTADSNGVPVSPFYVSWSTSDTTKAPIDSLGVLRAPNARGNVFVRAITPNNVRDSTAITFTPLPTGVAVVSGSGQTGAVATRLPLPLRVQVTASDAQGVKGIPVRFQALSGGGPADTVIVTDAGGFAADTVTLGTVAGPQRFQASVAGIKPDTITVTATAGAISAARSIVTVSSDTVISGTTATLTLHAKDAFGNNLTTGGATVAFSASGGTSTGTIGPTTDNHDGTYSATFSGALAGTATTIGATVSGTTVGTTLPTIRVTVGVISAATSVVSLSGTTVASGTFVTLTLQAKDAAGNIVITGGATVTFNATGGTSTGTISTTTDHANGTYTATFTGAIAGTATTIGATVNGSAVTATLPTLSVTPGAVSAAQSVVTASSPTVASGTTATLTLQAKDASGNNLTTGGATVAFTTTGGTSTGAISSSTDHNNGTYTATFTGVVAGTATPIGATVNGTAVGTALPTVTVTAGAISAATSAVSLSSAIVASGTSVTLALQARDAAGNTVTAGGATVVFNATGGTSTGTISTTTDHANGTYTATYTGAIAGTANTIGATVNGIAVSTSLPVLRVTAGAISATTSVVTASSGTVASGASATLTLLAKDAAGNTITTGGATVVFSATGGTSTGTIGAVTDRGNGSYSATFTGIVAGTAITFGASVNGTATISTTSITVVPGNAVTAQSVITVSANTVSSGGALTLTLQARDSVGNTITTGGLSVVFNNSGGTSTGTIGSTTDHGNGTYTATFTAVLAGTATTIGATIGGAPVTSTLPTVTVTPGAISPATSLVSVSSATVVSGVTLTLTLLAKDAAGNPIATGGATVVFNAAGGTSTGAIGATTDNGNGTYTAIFTGALAGTPATIGATINGTPVTTTLPTVTVTPGAISPATSVVSVSSATVTSGGALTLSLQAKDAAGNVLATGGATVVFTATGGTSTGSIGVTTDHANGTYTATFTGVLAGTATTIGATINATAVTSTLPTVTVSPGAISTATSMVLASSGTVASGLAMTLTLQAKDAAGNAIATGGATVVFTATGGTSTGGIGATTDHANGTYTATFTGLVAGTATTIGATINGSPVSSTLPTVTVTPGAISPATSIVTVADSTVLQGSVDTLLLQAKDGVGNNLAIGGAVVVFTQSGGTSIGTISPATDLGNGSYRALFTGSAAGTPTTIGGTINGVTVTSTPLPTIRVRATIHTVDITADSTWTAALSPHIVAGYLRIRNGATLTIQPGAVVKFNVGAGLQVGDTALNQAGGLILDGTGPGITLTANTGTPTLGFWRGLEVQRMLPALPPWRRTLIEWAGGTRAAFGGVPAEACVLVVNRSGAALDVDSLHIRQCAQAGINHFGGSAHVHRSEIDTVTGSGIDVDIDATLQLDSTTVRGAGQEGLFFASPSAHFLPSSANRFVGNASHGVQLHAFQLPGLLQQDSIAGNGIDFIGVGAGQPDPTASAFTIFAQPQRVGSNGYLIQGGLLDVGRVGGQAITLDSNVVLRFNSQSGLVIGDSAGNRSGTIHSLGTKVTNQPQLLAASGSGPGLWLGVEIGRLSAADTLKHLRIQYAGDSLPGRTAHRAGLWVRNPAAVPLVLDSLQILNNGSTGAVLNSGGIVTTARGGGVEVRFTVASSNPGFGFMTQVPLRLVDDTAANNTIGLGAFIDGGSQITPADSFTRDVFVGNVYGTDVQIGATPMFRNPITHANQTDTLLVDGGRLTVPAALGAAAPLTFRFRKGITLDSGAVLTLLPGQTIAFDDSAQIVVGQTTSAALRVPGTGAQPVVLTATPGQPQWNGLVFQSLSQADTLSNVIIEKAGRFIPPPPTCSKQLVCFSVLLGSIRFTNSSSFGLLLDSITVRNAIAYGVEALPTGTGTVTIRHSQFYADPVPFHASTGVALTVTQSDIYNYGRVVVVNNSSASGDSVDATNNWWGDAAGLAVGGRDTLSLGQTSSYQTRFVPFARTPFFPAAIGTAASIVSLGVDSVQTAQVGTTLPDSIRARVLDANGRGVAGQGVSWTTNKVSVLPTSSVTDIGGRVGSAWTIGTVAETDTARAGTGSLTPARFLVNLLPGFTQTEDWQVLAALTVADSVHSHPGIGEDTIFYSSTNHTSAFKTNARDQFGNVTQPIFGPVFDQGPCSNSACRSPAADSVKGDTVYFRPPVVGDYVISGGYDNEAVDTVVLRVTPVAASVRIDRDQTQPGVQSAPDSALFTSLCPTVGPFFACQNEYHAFVIDSGGAAIGNQNARLQWISPAFPDTIVTIDLTRGTPANDTAFVSAHANGKSFVVVVDTATASATHLKRDSLPIVVIQTPADVLVSPNPIFLFLGDTVRFKAAVVDEGGDTVSGAVVHWRIDPLYQGLLTILDTSIANQALVRADGFGSAQIDAFACCGLAGPADTLFGFGQVSISPPGIRQSFVAPSAPSERERTAKDPRRVRMTAASPASSKKKLR